MFNVGPMELLVLLVLALIVFGPAKLPEIFGSVGRAIAEFRRASQELTDVFTTEMNTVQSEISAIESTVEDLTAEVRAEVSSVPQAIQSPAVQSSRTTTAPTTYSTPIKPALNQGIPINTFPAHAPLEEHRPPAAFAQMISIPDAARPPPPFWAIPVPATPPVSSTPPVIQEVASTVVDVDQTPIEVMQTPIEQIPNETTTAEATTAELVVGDVDLDLETPVSPDGKTIDGIVAEPLVSATATVEHAEAASVNREDSARGDAAPEESVEIGESPSEHESLATPSIGAVSLENEPDVERSQDKDNGVPATTVAGSNGATKSRGRRPKVVFTAGE